MRDDSMAEATAGKETGIEAGAGVIVRRAVAAGLRQHLAPDNSPVPEALQRLLDELRRQEAGPAISDKTAGHG